MPLLSNKLLSIGLLLALVFALAALAGWFTAEANPQGILLHTPAADGRAIAFYEGLGFRRAGHTQSMWIYAGSEH